LRLDVIENLNLEPSELTMSSNPETIPTSDHLAVRPGLDADQVRQRLRELVAEDLENRVESAEILSLVHQRKYWREWGYPSLKACIREEFKLSLTTARLLMNIRHAIVDRLGLALDRVRDLDWSKLVLVTKALTPEHADAVLEDVKNLSYRELKDKYRPAKRLSPARITVVTIDPFDLKAIAKAPAAAGWRRPRPPEDEFYVSELHWEQISYGISHAEPVLLLGPSGCGKTELCRLAAQAYGKELLSVNCGGMSEARTSLIGNTHFSKDKGTWFEPSRFVRAVQNHLACVLFDEISRAQRDAFNILLPVLDGQRSIPVDESENAGVVQVAHGVNFLATANVGAAYTGTDPLDLALLDRFPVVLEMEFPLAKEERGILMKRCPDLSYADAQELVRFAGRQREMTREGEFNAMISTRTLLAAGRQVAAGISRSNAIEFCILNRFAQDGGDISDRTKLRQLLQKLMG
jgi:MoxR-like ATPase